MPTGAHNTWVLRCSFKAPKTVLPLECGERRFHWNQKQTQEEREKSERGWKRGEKDVGWTETEITTGSTQRQQRKGSSKRGHCEEQSGHSQHGWRQLRASRQTRQNKYNEKPNCDLVLLYILILNLTLYLKRNKLPFFSLPSSLSVECKTLGH